MSKQNLNEKISRIEERIEQIEKQLSEKPAKRLLTTDEAAQFLGMSVDGLRGLTHKKLISFYKPNGKNMYFDTEELVAWQKKHHFEPIYGL